jgi:hypothetical protein
MGLVAVNPCKPPISLALLPGARNCPLEQNVVHFCVTQYSHMTATPAVDAALHSETDLDLRYLLTFVMMLVHCCHSAGVVNRVIDYETHPAFFGIGTNYRGGHEALKT